MAGARSHGRTLEDILEIMVRIQSTELLWFLGPLQLSLGKDVLRAVVGLPRQPAVGPQVPFGAESMGCLQQRNQLSCPKRTDTRNLA